ncbi:FadR/GntR family transcriptional regulator [Herbiconiux daphne]|uniref:GntR family transcriptional regulator n=1 Tax=Herbiconiux daphne TaxID=2970914 RepID=A0ABT2H0U5_9MICO|nr:GntR family transcriptional regulator [Herbiconiux daphne]MCS5733557.1 GntR family transcriptional regulator [Herbiconiux daphne]
MSRPSDPPEASEGSPQGAPQDAPHGTPESAGAPALPATLLLRSGRTTNAFEECVEKLLQTVRLGVVAPGNRLPAERELAALMGVSRDTLREALASLADAGYLEARRGRYGGTFVSDPVPSRVPRGITAPDAAPTALPDADALADVLTLRDILEPGAARAAANRSLTALEREQLWSALRDTADADAADYRRLDSRLHLVIAELAGSASLVPIVAENRMRVNALLDAIPLLEKNIEHSNEQHEALVGAILTGRGDDAARVMAEHIAGSAALLRGFLS